jgi:hypothetical protein
MPAARTSSAPGRTPAWGHFPSHDYGLNNAWLGAAMIACILLSWLKLLALGRGRRTTWQRVQAIPHPHLNSTNPFR